MRGWSVRTLADILVAAALAYLCLQAASFVFRDAFAVSRRGVSELYLPMIAGLTAITAAAVVRPAMRGTLAELLAHFGDRAVFVVLFIPSLVIAIDRFRSLPGVDPVQLFEVGNDPLTYASWGRSILEHPRPFVEPTAVFSKPLFAYWRAVEYLVFGDGTQYARELLMALLRISGLALVAFSTVASVASAPPTNKARYVLGIGAWLLASVATLYVCTSISRLAAPWVPGFSEGPAWLFAMLGMAACVLVPVALHGRALYWNIGWLLGISLLFRTNQLLIAAAFPFVLLALSARGAWREVAWLVAPVAICFALIFGHALLDTSAWQLSARMLGTTRRCRVRTPNLACSNYWRDLFHQRASATCSCSRA
jgi:hypothetical protein